jgi:hypothetical protein
MSYVAVHAKALNRMRSKQAVTVTFVGPVEGEYDPETDTYLPPGEDRSVMGLALELPGNAEEYAALELILQRPITLFFVPFARGAAPAHDSQVLWAGEARAIKQSFPVRPDGIYIGARLILV